MKITKTKLKQVIKEEVVKFLTENEDQQYARKILEFLDHEDPWQFAQGVVLYSTLKDDIETNAPTENDQILEKLKVIDQFADSDIKEKNVNETFKYCICVSIKFHCTCSLKVFV